jgi:hypothetical protein
MELVNIRNDECFTIKPIKFFLTFLMKKLLIYQVSTYLFMSYLTTLYLSQTVHSGRAV